MVVLTIPVGVFRCNCTILICETTGAAIVVDPGDDGERIVAAVRRHASHVGTVVHTHAHLDHLMATADVVKATSAEPRVHKADAGLWSHVAKVSDTYRIPAPVLPPLGRWLVDGERISFGTHHLTVIHTPGHTPGSCCFMAAQGDAAAVLLSGDALVDSPQGRSTSHPRIQWPSSQLPSAARERLLGLQDQTRVIPGHGPETNHRRDAAQSSSIRPPVNGVMQPPIPGRDCRRDRSHQSRTG
jgi:hydroxyacylglutathione hydrolase